jgi:hypothetical protein
VNKRDFFVIEDDCPNGIKIMSAEDSEKRVIEQRFSTSPGTTSGSTINENSIFLLDAGTLKIFDFNGNLLLEYFIQIPGSDSSINQIEINENILYVLDTRGHNIHMFEITYE